MTGPSKSTVGVGTTVAFGSGTASFLGVSGFGLGCSGSFSGSGSGSFSGFGSGSL
jgi:hypothetical protein